MLLRILYLLLQTLHMQETHTTTCGTTLMTVMLVKLMKAILWLALICTPFFVLIG